MNTSAVADYPQQHRLIEVMDNRDGTLSIFGTLLDHASPATAPAGGDASSFDPAQLASIARTLAFNDPQTGAAATGAAPAGTEKDGNVELLLGDPRSFECQGETATVVGSEGSDKIKGTRGRDVILALGGNDKVKTGRGKDLVCGGSGEDKAKGGGGADRLRGDNGKDKLKGGRGGDRLYGGTGRDRLKGGKGRDRLNGGKARDSCKGGAGRDRTRSC
jgi:Ca2+-binding RTX toxin-like protein